MIIGLSGYAGSGKDTAAALIQTFNQGWEIKKFAGKLKQIASLLTGIPVEKFEDQEFKKTVLGNQWTTYGIIREGGIRQVAISPTPHSPDGAWLKNTNNVHIKNKMSVREFLQKLGTDALRDGLHPNTWVNALMADYKPLPKEENWFTLMPVYPRWIITDVRFPNEAKAILDRGGEIWRIVRGEKVNDHPSETSLDDWKFNRVIHNNSTLEHLEQNLRKAYEHFTRQHYA